MNSIHLGFFFLKPQFIKIFFLFSSTSNSLFFYFFSRAKKHKNFLCALPRALKFFLRAPARRKSGTCAPKIARPCMNARAKNSAPVHGNGACVHGNDARAWKIARASLKVTCARKIRFSRAKFVNIFFESEKFVIFLFFTFFCPIH